MKIKKYIFGIIILSSSVFFSCGEMNATVEAVVESSKKVIESDMPIIENSVNWDTEVKKQLAETKKIQVLTSYLEEHKGPVAKREAISSVDIYNSMKKHCAKYDIGIEILIGLSIEESNVTQKPRDSVAGCRGICQVSRGALSDFNTNVIWPKYHDGSKFYTWEDMYDYDKNIEVACYYIRWLWDSFSDIQEIGDVLISYNAGHGKLAKYKLINDPTVYHYHTDIIEHAKECNYRVKLCS